MLRLAAIALSGVLGLSTMASAAQPAQGATKGQHVIPVLVSVNSHGKVTDVTPAYRMRPEFSRLLRSTLDQMIKKPAMRHGKAVSSQFVMNMALNASKRSDGQYQAKFDYVSSKPLPTGSWYWVHRSDGTLALSAHGMDMPMRRSVGTPDYHGGSAFSARSH